MRGAEQASARVVSALGLDRFYGISPMAQLRYTPAAQCRYHPVVGFCFALICFAWNL
jgi:hypothetical protein